MYLLKSSFLQLYASFHPRDSGIASEIAKYLNARQVTDVPYGLTSVPEGFVGIYDLDDLDLLRAPAHSETDFILMNDIDIPEEAEFQIDIAFADDFGFGF